MKTLSDVELNVMFEHYIKRKMYNQSVTPGTQDDLYSAGECREAERWLALFGVDTSYERVQKLIKERREENK